MPSRPATGGRNYGWNIMEGDLCFRTDRMRSRTGLTLPVAVNHSEHGECAIIGGYVYRGSVYPDLVGTYMYLGPLQRHSLGI